MTQQSQWQQLTSHHDALNRFDAAVANCQITYSPTTPIPLADNGFEFQFRICPQFLHKPQLPPADNPSDATKSDISQPLALQIADIPPSHNLTFNAYPTLRPSYLLLTTSPCHHQTSPLSITDITAARTTLASLSSEYARQNGEEGSKEASECMLIYNSGRAAGCSRFHKHMQIFPRPSRDSFRLFPDRAPDDLANVPYEYDLIRHRCSPSSSLFDDPTTLAYIFNSYISSLARFRDRLGIQHEDEPVPHNVIMTREWTVVIPRRVAQSEGLSANAAGMMGMVWVGTEWEMEEWKQKGAWRILGELGLQGERKT